MSSVLRSFLVLTVAGCTMGDGDDDDTVSQAQDGRVATAWASGSDRLTPEELEAGRMRMDWRTWVERDTTDAASDSIAADEMWPESTERWEDISFESVNSGPVALPLYGDVAGPSVLRVQVLLDRARFSPGIIDGSWGRNTEKAIYWLQRREGMRATGRVDEATWQRLQAFAGPTTALVRVHELSADDVAGPFVTLPSDYYERRDMACQCYESLAEKLAEAHHTTEDLLRQLNPGVDLDAVQAGMRLNVPAVGAVDVPVAVVPVAPAAPGGSATTPPASIATQPQIARLVISDGGGYVQAVDAADRIIYHFPATLGSDYSPSPSGDYRVTTIMQDPSWHYQPELLAGVDDAEPDAVLPPGPNNAVGVVWMQLSREHYGVHGTSAPETIGYAVSNGCVRLTNWDAAFLSRHVRPKTPVSFRDVD